MSDQILDSNGGGTGTRPTFLTVLCILTFIGSAWGALGNFVGANAYMIPIWYKLALLACNLATGYGAWQMWNLKKQGLMIYTAGEGLAVIFPLVLIYAILPPGFADLFGSIFLIAALFPIAFIIMYWSNAKHLK